MSRSTTKLVSILFLLESIFYFVYTWMLYVDAQMPSILLVITGIISVFLFVAWFSSFPINIPVATILGDVIIYWQLFN